ncbi:hypothetical protein CXG81DRAFT_26557 [Caulochytrium protostelioides]|uniref:Pre-mRNA-splicing factor SPF27 n=1 Tax=Caulochytrium protostelioides TaxID=1555241 RepID=A0A4P9X6V3_9FUNG|nr:hypothetical protein CXG81DRAFT_26557 [Caulochytrium protostelioides]|eukprot:RKP00731.1 hypothetical protein CXG81DRAFT_26557 [Caulochytrium protostelioides]
MSGRVLLDSLPYVDNHLEAPGVAAAVEALIADEKAAMAAAGIVPSALRRATASDPAAPQVEKPLFDGHPVLADLYARTARGEKLDALDRRRYRLEPPMAPDSRSDDADDDDEPSAAAIAAWRAAVDNARVQLAHQETRRAELALVQRFGGTAFRAANAQLAAAVAVAEAEAARAVAATQAVNRKRKADQLLAGKRLDAIEMRSRQALANIVRIQAGMLLAEATAGAAAGATS